MQEKGEKTILFSENNDYLAWSLFFWWDLSRLKPYPPFHRESHGQNYWYLGARVTFIYCHLIVEEALAPWNNANSVGVESLKQHCNKIKVPIPIPRTDLEIEQPVAYIVVPIKNKKKQHAVPPTISLGAPRRRNHSFLLSRPQFKA